MESVGFYDLWLNAGWDDVMMRLQSDEVSKSLRASLNAGF